MPASLENQTQHKHAHTHIKRNKESDMHIDRCTYTKDTIHTHTDICPPLLARVYVCR
jgi:hypothetical protein